jgi:hypothetical protein
MLQQISEFASSTTRKNGGEKPFGLRITKGPKDGVDIDHRSREIPRENIYPLPIRCSEVVESCVGNFLEVSKPGADPGHPFVRTHRLWIMPPSYFRVQQSIYLGVLTYRNS